MLNPCRCAHAPHSPWLFLYSSRLGGVNPVLLRDLNLPLQVDESAELLQLLQSDNRVSVHARAGGRPSARRASAGV